MNGSSLMPAWNRAQWIGLAMGVCASLICLIAVVLTHRLGPFYRAYLFAFLFWVSLPLGCMAILMLHHLVGGKWGFVIRRMMEAAALTVPMLAVLFVPVLMGLPYLYPWARAGDVMIDPVLQHKQAYLNAPFFWQRASACFVCWIALAYFLNKWSLAQDALAEPAIARRLQLLSGAGLVVYGLTVTVAGIDWLMSLDPHWYSSIYGMMFASGQLLTALAAMVGVLLLLRNTQPLRSALTANHLNDLGNLLLALVMLWAYMAFSQFLIIWGGNLPEETSWYVQRIRGGWKYIAIALVVVHFALPFLLLLSRDVKRNPKWLLGVVAVVLVMRFVDLFWLVKPSVVLDNAFHWMDAAVFVGLGGFWVAMFISQLKRRPLLPLHDPTLLKE